MSQHQIIFRCECGGNARYLQVKKESVNQGRWFYTCDNDICNAFLWADDAQEGDCLKERKNTFKKQKLNGDDTCFDIIRRLEALEMAVFQPTLKRQNAGSWNNINEFNNSVNKS